MEKTAFSQYLEDTLNNNIKYPAYYLKLEKKQLIEAYRVGFLSDDIKLSSKYYTNKFNK